MSPVDGEFILYPHGRKPIYCAYENNIISRNKTLEGKKQTLYLYFGFDETHLVFSFWSKTEKVINFWELFLCVF